MLVCTPVALSQGPGAHLVRAGRERERGGGWGSNDTGRAFHTGQMAVDTGRKAVDTGRLAVSSESFALPTQAAAALQSSLLVRFLEDNLFLVREKSLAKFVSVSLNLLHILPP